MKKRALSLFLALILCLSLTTATFAAETIECDGSGASLYPAYFSR